MLQLFSRVGPISVAVFQRRIYFDVPAGAFQIAGAALQIETAAVGDRLPEDRFILLDICVDISSFAVQGHRGRSHGGAAGGRARIGERISGARSVAAHNQVGASRFRCIHDPIGFRLRLGHRHSAGRGESAILRGHGDGRDARADRRHGAACDRRYRRIIGRPGDCFVRRVGRCHGRFEGRGMSGFQRQLCLVQAHAGDGSCAGRHFLIQVDRPGVRTGSCERSILVENRIGIVVLQRVIAVGPIPLRILLGGPYFDVAALALQIVGPVGEIEPFAVSRRRPDDILRRVFHARYPADIHHVDRGLSHIGAA